MTKAADRLYLLQNLRGTTSPNQSYYVDDLDDLINELQAEVDVEQELAEEAKAKELRQQLALSLTQQRNQPPAGPTREEFERLEDAVASLESVINKLKRSLT